MTAAPDPQPIGSREEWLASLTRVYAAAGCLLSDDQGRILIVKAGYREHWQFAGGTIEPGETPAECAGRELTEETGLVGTPGDLLVVSWANPSADLDYPAVHFIYDLGTVPADTPVTIPAGELDAYRWADPAEAHTLLGPARGPRLAAALEARADGRTRTVTTAVSGI
jgi:8-oxo-dGTP pyrophosphatase MutT (NUDIX family)